MNFKLSFKFKLFKFITISIQMPMLHLFQKLHQHVFIF